MTEILGQYLDSVCYKYGLIYLTKHTVIRIRLYIKNETSLKKRNLERNRPKKTQPRRRQVSEKKKRNLPEGQVSEKKNATWPTARLRFF